ncbi:unnamed protein product [Polarella glacialis]|uniref:DNA mismatch repair protein S5 domain-containing protein n=1 Tax=Polarella glacialis TaxID=89957 RepID=A0A813KLV3_POLGL|nr:unnamed protein product [Polarella glacialis]
MLVPVILRAAWHVYTFAVQPSKAGAADPDDPAVCGAQQAVVIGLHEEIPIHTICSESDLYRGSSSFCSPGAQHFEVPREHPVALCLLDKEPAEGIEFLVSTRREGSFEFGCRNRQRHLYWLVALKQLSRGSDDRFYSSHLDQTLQILVCAPAACTRSMIASWMAQPFLSYMMARQGTPQPNSGGLQRIWSHASHFSSSAMACQGPGYVRLPLRTGLSVHVNPGLTEQMEWAYTKHLFMVPDMGSYVFVGEQQLPDPALVRPSPLFLAPSGVALLLAGQWRFRQSTVESIRRQVVEPLGAQVFGAFSRMQNKQNVTGASAQAALRQAFGASLQGFAWLQDMPIRWLKKEFAEVLPLLTVMGGFALAPLTSGGPFALHNLRKLEAVFDLLEACEAARGFRFEFWMAQHPLPSLLDQDALYLGLSGCDWHAVAPRALASAYFRRYSSVRSGTAPVQLIHGTCTFLMNAVTFSGVRIGGIARIAELDSCGHAGCFTPKSDPRSRWRRPKEAFRTAWLASGLQRGRLGWVRAGALVSRLWMDVAEVWNFRRNDMPALILAEFARPNSSSGPARLLHHPTGSSEHLQFEVLDTMVGPCPEQDEAVRQGPSSVSLDATSPGLRRLCAQIREYDDLNQTLTTFGFRGEALSAICAMGDMTVSTRTAEDASAWLLSYDRFGKLTSSVPAAREVGTTVSVREVFKRLPVRHKEFLRNAKAQVSATLRLIQSYAIAQPEIRFHVVAEKVRGNGAGRATLLTTSGSARGWKEAVAAVLGDAAVADVRPLELQSATGWHISGLISSPHGGRRSRDSQLFYVNRRPIDPPKRISKLINDTYHQYNSRACPLVILSFTAGQGLVDVNVTPDKRTVFLHNEEALLADLQQGLTELYSSSASPGGPGASLSNFGIRAVAPARNAADDEAAGCSQGDNLAALAADASEGFLPVPASQPASQRMASPVLEAQTPEVGAASRRQVAFNGPETPEKAQAACVATSPEPVFEEAEASASGPSWRVFSAAPDEPAGELGFRITELSAPGASRGSLDLPRTSWPQPLKRRPSELSEMSQPSFRVIELVPEDSVMPPAVITEGLAEELGFKLIEEYLPQPRGSGDDEAMKNSEALQDDDVLMEDDAGQPTQALGCSFQASVSLAELGAAVARKRRRRQAALAAESPAQDMPPTASSPSVQFPNAFSLAALRPGAAGASSLNEVAKFATSGSPASNTAGNDGAGLRFDKSCFTQMQVIGQFNLGFIIAALRTDDDSKDERGQGRQGSAGPSGRGLQLFIIDQHASDEKFRFEALNRESKIDRQPLVSPHPLQLTPAQDTHTLFIECLL